MDLKNVILTNTLIAIWKLYNIDLPESEVQVQNTKENFKGDYTVVIFPLTKYSKKSVKETALEIGKCLKSFCRLITNFYIVDGFLNLRVCTSIWFDILNFINKDDNYGKKPITENSPLVMIEFSSPNTNKPLHLGHIRNILLGWSMSKIIEANGCKVIKTNLINDRGIHICKSMLAWQKWSNGITPERAGVKGDHFVGDFYVKFEKRYREEINELAIKFEKEGLSKEDAKVKAEQESQIMKEAREMLVKWESSDVETRLLWEQMNDWVYSGFEETYNALGVNFDKVYYESETYTEGKKVIKDGLNKKLFISKEDNSIWVDLTSDGLDQKLLLRGDGTSVYITQDVGTAKIRFADYPIDKMIYVVGNEQNYHFKALSIILDRLGFKCGKDLVHLSYGMVELPNGKMKSREGTVVDADDLISSMIQKARVVSEDKVDKLEGITDTKKDEIARIVGLGALKYFILKIDAKKNMLFNPDESIDFNGNTGPFIQYTYARLCSILKNAEKQNIYMKMHIMYNAIIKPEEISLIKKMNDFDKVVTQAYIDYNPSIIANYCYELAKEFNKFYSIYRILDAEESYEVKFRIVIVRNIHKIIKSGMNLLGIECPDRM
jgi:arginyl-tRNA synthetase